ncbi:MAG TPA: carboxypeptidase-like regulatory domain-containing protein [Methanocella sp.]|uniref:carboxypeptidase-like regulatory domain-containing protein n=1 Tax=Methanocella sp. TaxID=2052833 RepID=UPI002B9EFDE0|nr:carboxypeptidase-like regulatory domain-containing protein [Methanocella sp.]HTY92134.1 carboxypeptidase-like regulatory domain-containing protein [Methanocella sp.]
MDRAVYGGRHRAYLQTAIIIAIISYAVLIGLGGPVGPIRAYADTPLIDNASATVSPPDVHGHVYDSKGNKVPNAHVTLYSNGSFMWLGDNPTYSSNGSDGDMGYYGFHGVEIGNYTVKAEIVDTFGDVYNGTVKAKKFDDRPVETDIIISSYVYSPWIKPSPTPEPAAVLLPITSPTAKPTALPMNKDQTGIFNPLYALAVSPVAVVGAFMFMRSKKRPASRNGYQYIDMGRSQTFLGDSKLSTRSNVISGFSEYFLGNAGYSSELEELVQSTIKYHYNDITVIHRVEKIAKKYGIELTVVYRDIKRIKNMMERGKYQ